MAEAKNAATINRLMSKRRSVLYFPNSTLLSRVKGHKGSPVLPRLLPSIVMGSLLRRAHFESLRAAEAKNAATINQLKYRSRSCITGNIALGAWSRANKALGCASCFIGSRPRPRAIFPVMHSHGTLTSIYILCAHTVIHVYILSLLKLWFCSELLERFSSERENGASDDTVYVASTDCSTDLDVLGVHTGGALVGSSERSSFGLGTRAG